MVSRRRLGLTVGRRSRAGGGADRLLGERSHQYGVHRPGLHRARRVGVDDCRRDHPRRLRPFPHLVGGPNGLGEVGAGAILESDWLGEPNIFRVEGGSLSGLDVLDRANTLALRPEVVFASVNFLYIGDLVTVEYAEVPSPVLAAHRPAPSPFAALKALDKSSQVCTPLGSPSDPLFLLSWGYGQISGIDINAQSAWNQCSGNAEVIVAVLDDGVDPFHPDLPRQLPSVDFTDKCASKPCFGVAPGPVCESHGTAVAGVIAAASNNVGTLGVAPNVTILPIRIGHYTSNSEPPFCFAVTDQGWVAEAVVHAAQNSVDIINLSWNYGFFIASELALAFEKAETAGVASFNSAGNNNDDEVRSPGKLPTVHSVSAIERNGNRMFLRPTFASNYGPNVAYTAPGQEIITTDRSGSVGFVTGDYLEINGTSFAAPHVAGLAALIKSCRPDFTSGMIASLLDHTINDMGDPGRDEFFGLGLINAGEAVSLAPDFIFSGSFDRGNLEGWSLIEGN